MLFLVTIPVGHLARVFLRSIHVPVPTAAIRSINNVDSGDCVGAFLPSVLVPVAPIFFLLLPSSPKVFRVIRVLGSLFLWALDLSFFRPEILCWLGLGCNSVYRSVALVALLIDVVADGGLYFGLGLGTGCFLN